MRETSGHGATVPCSASCKSQTSRFRTRIEACRPSHLRTFHGGKINLVQNTLPCTFLAAPYVYNRCLRMLLAGSDASTLRRSMHLKRSSSRWKSKFLVGRGVLKKTKFRLRWEPVAFLQAGFRETRLSINFMLKRESRLTPVLRNKQTRHHA